MTNDGKLYLEDDGFSTKPGWLTATGTNDWSYTNQIQTIYFPQGEYQITVQAFDTKGNVGKKYNYFNIGGVGVTFI
ncbi:MAG TPA: hypothetical protein EYP59_21105 [Thiotrichaceae bacterium]|nr:hypothetical protein [Thiotrichaceae bacterium]